ncbi:hypothetical protein AJ88_26930 [Mesorhizobium amorphae CCBAU 01583]|nr:hypothetical protein AJ88_26930 [Mesorhizobium amorphae CCBAU 01583]
MIHLRRTAAAHPVEELAVGTGQRRLFGRIQSRGGFLKHDALVKCCLFQVASADRPDAARRKKRHLTQIRQQTVLTVLQVGQGVETAQGGIAWRSARPQRRMHRVPILVDALCNKAQSKRQPGQFLFIGQRPRDNDKQAQVTAMAAQFFRLVEHGRPVDRNGGFDRLVVTLLDDLDLGFGEPLDLVKGRIVAQISPRRVFTVQRIQPECEINHTNPQQAALRPA